MNKRKLLFYGLPLIFAGVIGGTILTLSTQHSNAQAISLHNGIPAMPQPTTEKSDSTATIHADNSSPTATPIPPTAVPPTSIPVTSVPSNPGSSPVPCQ